MSFHEMKPKYPVLYWLAQRVLAFGHWLEARSGYKPVSERLEKKSSGPQAVVY
jgi:hypothetical protein